MPPTHAEGLAENAILRAELHKARERARVMALIARRANDALEVLVCHMTTHDMQKPPAAETEGSYPPAPTTTHEGTP